MPLQLIEECADDPARLADSIRRYYRENWVDVRETLIRHIDSYKVDTEAKDAFREALIVHEHGCYRVVPRYLFPEIERVARVELYKGTLGKMREPRGKKFEVMGFLQEMAGELPVGEVLPRGYFGLRLFERLTDHLYAHVGNEQRRKRMEADAVPNRHAAVHGLIAYRSFENSLNTVLMTDYVFQIVAAVKRRLVGQGSR